MAPDGTIYVAGAGAGAVGGTDAITALRPDGSVKWTFTGAGDYLIAGPSVGPDGNVYAVTDVTGIGFFSLTPAGAVRFNTGRFTEHGSKGQRIAFGLDRAYFGFDMGGLQQLPTLFAYDLNGGRRWTAGQPDDHPAPAVGPNGNVVFRSFPTDTGKSLASHSPTGARVYSFYEFPGNTQEPPDVGPDNVAYTVRNLSTLYALNPNGSVRFRYNDDGIMFEPVVRPQNDLLFMGGRITYGEPGFFRAVSTAGRGLWQVPLPTEPGYGDYGQLVPSSRPVFSPDGGTAYVVVDVAGDGNTPYGQLFAYLYAINVTPSCLGMSPTIVGSGAIDGTAGDDVIVGSSGADVIRGLGGNDRICGGGGADRINGGVGNDRLDGGVGLDTATFAGGGAVNVNLVTGSATGQGSDTLVLIENLTGGGGSDTITGNDGRNVLVGGGGKDSVTAGLGNDTVRLVDGVSGNDSGDGGGGTDTCTADSGDTLTNCSP